ncbi:MAG TPA: hypothetical protein VN894_13320, partial [Polyangiaceae bacterium]|nr:hypothetical protein [Polyangiaceae bacterium]
APARLLDACSRAIVERVASDVCAYRGWDMFAASARTTRPCAAWCTVKTSRQARFDELNLTAP